MSIRIREMAPADRAFVVKSWRDSWFAEHASGPILDCDFDVAYLHAIDTIVDAPGTKVLVAAWEGEAPPYDIAGYAVVERRPHEHDKGRVKCARPIVHWCYVKPFYRGRGIAGALMSEEHVSLRRDPPPNPRGSRHAGETAPGPDTYCATFRTRIGSAIVESHWHGGRFDPLTVRFMPNTTAAPKARMR